MRYLTNLVGVPLLAGVSGNFDKPSGTSDGPAMVLTEKKNVDKIPGISSQKNIYLYPCLMTHAMDEKFPKAHAARVLKGRSEHGITYPG